MNFSWNLSIFVCAVLVAMVTGRSTNRHLNMDNERELKLEDSHESSYETTTHHFARHVLCQNNTGKKVFLRVMEQKLKDLKQGFVRSFVADLCGLHSRNDSILDRWVQVLFDTDSDGFISQSEMNYIL